MHRRPGRCGEGARGSLGLLRRGRPHGTHPSPRCTRSSASSGTWEPWPKCTQRTGTSWRRCGRPRGVGRGAPGRQMRALHPQSQGRGQRAGLWAEVQPAGRQGSWGPPLLTDHPRPALLKNSPTKMSLWHVPSTPWPRGPRPRGSWTRLPSGRQQVAGSVACPSATLRTALGRAEPMASPSAPGLRGRVPVPPPFLLVPSGPPPPDAHRPGPAGPLGARVLWSAGRSHTEHASPTLQSSPQTTSPDRLALPPQGPGGRWRHLGSQAGCRGLVPSFSLRPAALRVPPIRPPAWPRCQEGAVRLSTQGRAGVRGRPARAGGLVMGLVGLAFPILHARAWRLCVFT